MRDRLIELLQDNSYLDVLDDEHWLLAAEQLLAEGVIVPPCKVGQTVYVTDAVDGKICECEVIAVTGFAGEENTLIEYEAPKEIPDVVSYECPDTELGKTVFLTRKEAEKALERRENDNT